jgi:hypothetical protein
MTADLNGHGPLAGWVIAILGSRSIIGKVGRGSGALCPVYDLVTELHPQQGPAYMAFPLLFLSSLRSVTLPPDAITIPVESLSHAERGMLARVVAQAEEMTGKLRAVESGIVPAGNARVVLK